MTDTVTTAIYRLQGVDEAASKFAGLAVAVDKAAAAEDRHAVTQERVGRANRTTTDQLERLISRYDATARAALELQRRQEQLDRLREEGIGSTTRLAYAQQLVEQKYRDQVTAAQRASGAVNDNSRSLGSATVSAGQMRFAVQNLSFQLNDIATSLASGGSPFRVLAQQGGQVVQAFQQGGGARAVIGGFVGSIASMITPARAATAGLIGLGAAGGALIAHNISLARETERVNALLDIMGTRALAAGINFREVARQLREIGIPGQQVSAALDQALRTQGINPAYVQRITTTGANISDLFGGQPAERATQLSDALAGGIQRTIEFGLRIRAFDADEAKNLRTMAEHEGEVRALQRAFDDIERAFAGRFEKTQSRISKGFDEIAAAAGRAWDAISATGPVQFAVDKILHALDMATALAEGRAIYLNVPFGPQIPLTAAGRAAMDASHPPTAPPYDWRAERNAAIGGTNYPTGGNSWLNRNAPFPTLANPGGAPVQWTSRPATGFDPSNPFATPLWGTATRSATAADEVRATIAATASVTTGLTEAQKDALAVQSDYNRRIEEAAKLTGEARIAAEAYAQAIGTGAVTDESRAKATEAARHAVEAHRVELERTAETQRLTNDLALATAKAYGTDEVSGLQAAARAQAELAVRSGEATDAGRKTHELLVTGAAEAAKASAQALPALVEQTAASRRLADATREGTGAAHDAAIENQIVAQTHDLLTKAKAAGIDVEKSGIAVLRDRIAAQIKANEAEQQAIKIREANNASRDQLAVLRLQTGLVAGGATSEEIARQVTLLQEKQKLDAAGASVLADEKANRLAVVDAVERAKIQLASATRESERWNDTVRSVAETIDQNIVRSLEDAFSGKRVQDWGEAIRNMLPGIAAQLTNALVIRPAIGQPLGAAGFDAGGQFGALGVPQREAA